MLYIVECTFTNPTIEEGWNQFYSQEKLPALVSVTGFSTSQRFRALKGGGDFSRWQAFITDWHRNVFECERPVPAVSSDEILLLSARPIGFTET